MAISQLVRVVTVTATSGLYERQKLSFTNMDLIYSTGYIYGYTILYIHIFCVSVYIWIYYTYGYTIMDILLCDMDIAIAQKLCNRETGFSLAQCKGCC